MTRHRRTLSMETFYPVIRFYTDKARRGLTYTNKSSRLRVQIKMGLSKFLRLCLSLVVQKDGTVETGLILSYSVLVADALRLKMG